MLGRIFGADLHRFHRHVAFGRRVIQGLSGHLDGPHLDALVHAQLRLAEIAGRHGDGGSGLPRLGRDLPPVELLEELDLVVRIDEFGPGLPLVSQVVDQVLEGAPVSVKEDLLVVFRAHLLQVVLSAEHLRKDAVRARLQNLRLSHHVVRAADIQ